MLHCKLIVSFTNDQVESKSNNNKNLLKKKNQRKKIINYYFILTLKVRDEGDSVPLIQEGYHCFPSDFRGLKLNFQNNSKVNDHE